MVLLESVTSPDPFRSNRPQSAFLVCGRLLGRLTDVRLFRGWVRVAGNSPGTRTGKPSQALDRPLSDPLRVRFLWSELFRGDSYCHDHDDVISNGEWHQQDCWNPAIWKSNVY
jgi:hypothetical protein